jgi:hypothetical protein
VRPSQLQEALKESTKVDAECDEVTWVPKKRVEKTKRRIPGEDLRVHHAVSDVEYLGAWNDLTMLDNNQALGMGSLM